MRAAPPLPRVHASDAGEVEHNGVEIVLVGDRCSDQPLDTRDRGEPQHLRATVRVLPSRTSGS